MKQPLEVTGITIQVRVSDMDVGLRWYTALLGRPPDAEPGDDAREWEILPNCWLYVALGTVGGSGALHLGVADVAAERERLQDALGVAITEVQRIEGEVAWCEFEDPFGNRLGLFEDLADSTNLA
jgi:catechol 2,3-dioxygenase-like lactoylglutathione lyase family enzyme